MLGGTNSEAKNFVTSTTVFWFLLLSQKNSYETKTLKINCSCVCFVSVSINAFCKGKIHGLRFT